MKDLKKFNKLENRINDFLMDSRIQITSCAIIAFTAFFCIGFVCARWYYKDYQNKKEVSPLKIEQRC